MKRGERLGGAGQIVKLQRVREKREPRVSQRETVAGQILPQVVERTVVEDAIRSAHDEIPRASEVPGEAEPCRSVIVVGAIKALRAARRRSEFRIRDALREACPRAQLKQVVLHGTRVYRRAVVLIANSVGKQQSRGDLEAVLREGGELKRAKSPGKVRDQDLIVG